MVLLAVKVGAVATPPALVATLGEPPKVPLAPLAGATKSTRTPGTGLLNESSTVALRAVENAVLMIALCGVPAVEVMVAAGPAVLVRLKGTVEVEPASEAI